MKNYIIIFTFFSSSLYSQNLESTDTKFQLPALIFENSRGNIIKSDVTGIVTKIVKNKDDKLLIFIRTNNSFYYKNSELTESYDFIYGNLSKVFLNINDKIKYGSPIGTCDPECLVTSSFEKLSPFPIRLSKARPMKFDNHYFFTPDWISSRNTNFLSFRETPSIQNFLNNYFKRWKDENDGPSDYTVFHTNSIDRIRFQTTLSDYPTDTVRNEGLLQTEQQIYSTSNLFFSESIISKFKVFGYTPVILWQKNFDKYLKEEYKLNSPLFIYASVTTIDHVNKRIYICARDFTQIDDEKVINDRIKEYKNL